MLSSVASVRPVAGAMIGQFGLRALVVFVAAHALGPNGQGELALGVAVATIGSLVAALGLDVAIAREAVEAAKHRAILSTGVRQVVGAGVVAGIAVLVVARTSVPSGAVVIGLCAIPAAVASRLVLAWALALRLTSVVVACLLVGPALNAGMVLALAALGALSATTALVAFLGATYLGLLGAAGRSFRRSLHRADGPSRNRRELYSLGFKALPGLAAQAANSRFDQLIIPVFLPVSELGYYSLAVAGAEAAALPGQAAGSVMLPESRRWSTIDLRKITRMLAGVSVAVLLIAGTFPLFVLALLPNYRNSLTPFAVLVPAAVAFSASRVLSAVVAGRASPWPASRTSIAAALLIVALDLVLIPTMGVVGAALATSVGYCVATLMLARIVRQLGVAP